MEGLKPSKYIFWILGLVVVVAIGYYFGDIVMYIILAWVVSLLGDPIMRFYQKHLKLKSWRIGPTGAAILTMFTFFAFLLIFLLVFVPPIVEQARNLAAIDYGSLENKLKEPFSELDAELHKVGILSHDESLGTRIKQIAQDLFDPSKLGGILGGVVSAAGNIMVTFTAVSFILFFFLQDRNMFKEMIHHLLPAKMEAKVVHAIDECSSMLTRYFGGLVAQLFSFAIICAVLLAILGNDNAMLIGSFGGLMNLVPYVGPIIGAMFGLFITITSHLQLPITEILPQLLKVIGAFAVTQMIDNLFMQPYIFSKSVKAHPLEIFIVTMIGAKFGGIAGMVLAIPTYTVLRVIGKVFFSEFRIVQALTEEEKEEKI